MWFLSSGGNFHLLKVRCVSGADNGGRARYDPA
jgi:hypothetical protein